MRQFNEDNLTEAVIVRLKDAKNPRVRMTQPRPAFPPSGYP